MTRCRDWGSGSLKATQLTSGETPSQETRDSPCLSRCLLPKAFVHIFLRCVRCGEVRTTVSNSLPALAGSSWPEVAGSVPSRCGGLHALFGPFSSCGSLVCSKARLAGLLLKSLFTLKRKNKQTTRAYCWKEKETI